MPETLSKIIVVALVLLMPLAWGLGAEYFFELLRRRKTGHNADEEAGQ